MCRFVLVVVLLVAAGFATAPVAAQERVSGRVTDAATGDILPGATIQIRGTYSGTISNPEGRFAILVPEYPATLVIRFIGYRTVTMDIQEASSALVVRMEPAALQMAEITISSEDPALGIMRRVIAEKQKWRAGLDTYAVDAYNRFRMENDTGIVSIWESFTRAYWDRERGVREVSIWQEQTENMQMDDLLPAAMLVVNLYDDDIEVAGHRLMGVTHPDALSMYRFRLDSLRAIDNTTVYDIDVEPRTRRGSGFVGRISILDGEWAMISAELAPGRSFLFPPPVDNLSVAYRQQFSKFSGTAWLPVDLVSHIDLQISLGPLLTFPEFRIRQLSRLTDFEINVPLPDSLYATSDVIVASAERVDVRPPDLVSVPLTPREQQAYEDIDSTMTVEKAFAPGGLAGRMVRMESDSDAGQRSLPGVLSRFSIRPDVWYNRVEGTHLGGGLSLELPARTTLSGRVGFGEASRAWTRHAAIERSGQWRFSAEYFDDIGLRARSNLRGRFLNSLSVLSGHTDYFDYVSREGGAVAVSYGTTGDDGWRVEAGWSRTDYAPVTQLAFRSFLGQDAAVTPNLIVPSGSLSNVRLSVTRSWEWAPFSIGPQKRLRIDLERGVSGSLNPSAGYTRAQADVWWRFTTFNRRRLMPQALDVRVVAGVMSDRTPLVRLGLVDGSTRLTQFGGLRSRRDRPYEGLRYGLLAWEHTFRTVPFEWLGLYGLVRRHWNVIAHGGAGKAWLPDGHAARDRATSNTHHELGVSVSGILTVIRLDATWRLDQAAFVPGISLSRIF